jgi:hypothetical protein
LGNPRDYDLRRNDQEGLIEMTLKSNMGCDYFQSHRVTHQSWELLGWEVCPGPGEVIFKTLASGFFKGMGYQRKEGYRRLFCHEPLDFIV